MSENKPCENCEHYTCISVRKIIKENEEASELQ